MFKTMTTLIRSGAKFVVFSSVAALLLQTGCGYSWQNKRNPWRDRGIARVYVRPLTNNTLYTGAEVALTSALVKVFARGEKVKLVAEEKDADAFVEGTVDSIGSVPSARGTVGTLTNDPSAKELSDIPIATEYTATATVTINLVAKTGGTKYWTQAFSQSKIFPGNNRFGLVGTTSALINSSQQQIAMGEIAQYIATDVYDAMFEAF
jgi:hypothetical protein